MSSSDLYTEYRIMADSEGWYVEVRYSENGPWLKMNPKPYPDANRAQVQLQTLEENKNDY
jgi:hypothetical protein